MEWHTERMSTKLIEQHLTDLQRRVASLEAAVKPRPRDAWKQIIGISKGQPLDREVARLGAEWRAKENKRFGQRFAKEVGMGNPAEKTIRHPNHPPFLP